MSQRVSERCVAWQHGIEQYFVDVIGADTFEGHRKPDPHALLWLMDKHRYALPAL